MGDSYRRPARREGGAVSENHDEQIATVEVLERLGREMLRLAADIRPDPEHSLKAKIIWNAAIAEAQVALRKAVMDRYLTRVYDLCAELQKLMR